MGLGDIVPDPAEEDDIDSYRNEDIRSAVSETTQLPLRLVRLTAETRRSHMVTVLKWVLEYTDHGYDIHQAKVQAFNRTVEYDEDLEDTRLLFKHVERAYEGRYEGEGLQDHFEDALAEFVGVWNEMEEHC